VKQEQVTKTSSLIWSSITLLTKVTHWPTVD